MHDVFNTSKAYHMYNMCLMLYLSYVLHFCAYGMCNMCFRKDILYNMDTMYCMYHRYLYY